jgi:hypothetical protein|tara:strand:+ start:21034 stop:21936 length:903 start_codon:yes stop_codon:yes gene_type:complete
MRNFMGFDGFTWFQGVVEDHNDPEQIGRVKVRCLGIHTEDKETLPTDDLPWAMVMMPTTSASISQIGHSPSGLLKGSWVMGWFRDGTSCQEPVVMGSFPGYPLARPNTSLGFSDPTGTHPIEIEEPDTSRLARGDRNSKLLKLKNTHLSAEEHPPHPIAYSSDTWTLMSNPYNARYPYNKVTQTESGHVIELDDTPSGERINIQHMSGSFIEMHPDGSIRILNEGTQEILVEKDFNTHVKGSYNIYVSGTATIKAEGNIDMESTKDIRAKCVNFVVDASNVIDLNGGSEIDADAPIINLN